ncbi:carbon-phosphorus lyase subunit PhnH, partial [Pseudomonas syringae pv. actinidiae]|nr:carbon-phosphorus lyase subunit PhnH [Pseudomonas syringae pv. actinidiae]
LDAGFWTERDSRNQFPCGLDMFFLAGKQMLGLPRSTRVQECA